MSATTVPAFHPINSASRLISPAAFPRTATANTAATAHTRHTGRISRLSEKTPLCTPAERELINEASSSQVIEPNVHCLRTDSVFPGQKLYDMLVHSSYFVDVPYQEGGRHQKFRRELIGLNLFPLHSLRRFIIAPVHPYVFVDMETKTLVQKVVC
jgi:hypothetical protein